MKEEEYQRLLGRVEFANVPPQSLVLLAAVTFVVESVGLAG